MKTSKLNALAPIKTFYVASEILPKLAKKLDDNLKKLKAGLEKAVKDVDKISDKELLNYHLNNWYPRYDNYVNSTWELKEIPLDECGTWPGMGGLPYEFTIGSVVDVAHKIEALLKDKNKLTWKTSRALYIEEIQKVSELITEYVPIIVMEDQVIRSNKLQGKNTPIHKKYTYDIDDGNHRAVALVLLGKKTVKALVGKRIYKSDLIYL